MAKAKWSFESASTIKSDIKDTYIKCVKNITTEEMYTGEYKLHLLEGMMMLFDMLNPYVEETPNENIQND